MSLARSVEKNTEDSNTENRKIYAIGNNITRTKLVKHSPLFPSHLTFHSTNTD